MVVTHLKTNGKQKPGFANLLKIPSEIEISSFLAAGFWKNFRSYTWIPSISVPSLKIFLIPKKRDTIVISLNL